MARDSESQHDQAPRPAPQPASQAVGQGDAAQASTTAKGAAPRTAARDAATSPLSSVERWAAASPMTIIGAVAIIVGGLLPAVTAKIITEEVAWLSAYLVLIAGVAAVALGLGQAFIGGRPPAGWLVFTEVVLYYAGNALVITGVFADLPLFSDLGGALLVLSLLGFIYGARGRRRIGSPNWMLAIYRAVIVVLLISIPIGLVLSHLRVA